MRPHLIEPSRSRSSASAPRRRSSASFSRTSPGGAQGRFAALADGDGELTALCHLGQQPRAVRLRLRGLRRPGGEVGSADADRRVRCRLRSLGGSPREAAATPARPPRPAGLRDHRATARGRHGAAAGDRRRPRPARPVVCGSASRGARRRPAASRPERLPLADADSGRGGALVALGGGRRDPVQGRGLRLDAERGPAAAGVDRSPGPQAGVRRPGAPRPDPAAARRHADRLPLRPGRERAAIRLYESVGMHHVLDYRSVLL